MYIIKKTLSALSVLTNLALSVLLMLLVIIKYFIPIVSGRRALPMDFKLGIITLTLVISHEFTKPTVMRGFCVMWNVFKVKTKLELQVEEYLLWKATFSVFIAEQQKEILRVFINTLKCKDIAEIGLNDIENYYNNLQGTPYGKIAVMTAIRCFMRFCCQKKLTNIKAYLITNMGISKLRSVDESGIITPMIANKIGRPANMALIQDIKILRDTAKLSFREIARAKKRDVGQVYRMYKYEQK